MADFAMPAVCRECPWRRDVPVGKFSPERYIRLAATCTPGGLPGIFACHLTPEGGPRACAGMLAVCGTDNNRVRLAISRGDWTPPEGPPPPDLYADYAEMAIANGVPRHHPCLRPWKESTNA